MLSTNFPIESCESKDMHSMLVRIPSNKDNPVSGIVGLVDILDRFFKTESPNLSLSKTSSEGRHVIYAEQNYGEKKQVIKSEITITPQGTKDGIETYMVGFNQRDPNYLARKSRCVEFMQIFTPVRN